jgi:hypothetical protein
LPLRIEAQLRRHLLPGPSDGGGGARADDRDEFIAVEREAPVFVHLPDEAKWIAPLARRRRVCNRFRFFRCHVRHAETRDQHRRGIAADAVERERRAGAMSHGAAARERGGGERLRSERGERAHAVEVDMRALGGGHERAVDRKRRNRLTAAGKQADDALAERQVGAGALDRDHENAGGLIGQRDARAGAGERASHAGAESAQASEPRSGSRRQGRRNARDLSRRGLARVEPARSDRCRRRRAEHGGADRVRPHDVAGIQAPQPSRQRRGRQRRQSTVAQARQLGSGCAHSADALRSAAKAG